MTDSIFDDAGWYRATTLDERIADWKAAGGRNADAVFDIELGRAELESWRSQAPFDDGPWFERRWRLAGIGLDDAIQFLGEPIEAVRARARVRPEWLVTLERAFERAPRDARDHVATSDDLRKLSTAGFLHAQEPLVRDARERLAAALDALAARFATPPFDRASIEMVLFGDLPWQLLSMSMRAMVLELNVARVEGRLAGDSGEQRFQSFIERLREREGALRFWLEYPVLARSLVRLLDDWVRGSLEFLERLCADHRDLERTFGGGRPLGPLVALRGGAGDSHGGGRAVAIATFASGVRVVYKPRSLAIDRCYRTLLEWLATRADLPPLVGLEVLDRGTWGWAEFAPPAPCADADAVRRFYRRQGAQLALLYALEATDCHFENLIAAGEQPVLVDLESLFHARIAEVWIEQPELRLVAQSNYHSVLRIGLLPQRAWSSEGFAGVDLSGLGGEAGQMSPDAMLNWAGIGTDEMRAVRERVALPGAENRPRLGDVEVSPIDWADDIVAGFAGAHRAIAAHTDELLQLLAGIEQAEVRSVLRATRAYGIPWLESFHPDFQRDAVELERFLDRLWIGVDECEQYLRVIRAEQRDLLRGDIPKFTTRVDSRDLWTSDGERVEEFWPASGLECVRRRLARLDENDLARQIWYVRASIATLTIESDALRWPSYQLVKSTRTAQSADVRARALALALRAGDRLAETALRDATDVAWVGLSFSNRQWGLVPLLDDLYAGVSGVIHFLAYLGHVGGAARHRDLARAALATWRKRWPAMFEQTHGLGAFSGQGGIVYALAHWGRIWSDRECLDHARAIVARIAPSIESDEDLDVVGGCAGLIPCLLALDRALGGNEHRPLVRRAAERIAARAKRQPVGSGWITRLETERPITGFSHGASGLAWALALAAHELDEPRWLELALDAARYEASHFDRDEGNWLDVAQRERDMPQSRASKALSLAWCYGAPGIGLARIELGRRGDAAAREEVRLAVGTTLARGFGHNHSLCHGDLGNLELVRSAADHGLDERAQPAFDELADAVLASIERDGFLCGVPLGVDSPGLLNGLAGIGYGLLRIAAPERVPSVLTLEPPR
ncbi:MAG: type 2 lantipeptide synthetase LanM family protein [Planctomycetes bacterium]|nr:type 2 lantipeptide synthetase LanM family protein [Planctomycetota bacterium]